MKILTPLAAILFLLGSSATAQAQSLSEACNPGVPPYIVTSAKPFTVTWLQDATGPTSPTDPTPIPERINGFTYSLDGGPAVDFTPTSGAPCGVGTAGTNAGKIPYLFLMPSGVAKGAHTLTITAWNFVLNPDGTPTTTRAPGVPAVVPFSAIDLIKFGPPGSPKNPKVWR